MCGDCGGKRGDKRAGLNIFFLFDHQLQVKRAASCFAGLGLTAILWVAGFSGDTWRSASALRLKSQTSNPIMLRLRSN